jgi:hypothetical protein
MFMKALAAVVVTAIVAVALSVTAADAAKKKRYQYRADMPYQHRAPARDRYSSDPPSLDGRVTGYPRTCGFDTFLRDASRTPIGPYCH